ncbi:C40 family peptidase [uncultured Mailhella sp.]|uniref:C40 family peptidase n=1 Tax=uncultured Mailhella sp. TaxID=1981031 RepID=UPI0025FEB6B3|nr:C40 family peptidase [uncultured Mailhella sp.]
MFPRSRTLALLVLASIPALALCACQPKGAEVLPAPETAPVSARDLLPGQGTPATLYRANLCPTVMSLGRDVADIARQHVGIRYRSGGASPKSGFDCSGFVYWVFSKYGVTVPRDSVRQSRAGHEVARDELLPGDIIIFRIANTPNGRHSAIYLGEGRFIHSPSAGSSVRVEKLNASYWSSHYLTARRVLTAPPCDLDLYADPEVTETMLGDMPS